MNNHKCITKLTSDYYNYYSDEIKLTSRIRNYNAIFNGDNADYWLDSRCIGVLDRGCSLVSLKSDIQLTGSSEEG